MNNDLRKKNILSVFGRSPSHDWALFLAVFILISIALVGYGASTYARALSAIEEGSAAPAPFDQAGRAYKARLDKLLNASSAEPASSSVLVDPSI